MQLHTFICGRVINQQTIHEENAVMGPAAGQANKQTDLQHQCRD